MSKKLPPEAYPPELEARPDEVRKSVASRVKAIMPKAMTDIMTEDEYDKRFLGRFVITGAAAKLANVEKVKQIVFCRSCSEFDELRHVTKATELSITYEKDGLSAVGHLAHCRCHRCGFEMHVDIPNYDPRNKEQKYMGELMRAREDMMKQYTQQGVSQRIAKQLADIQQKLTEGHRQMLDAAQLRPLYDHMNHLQDAATREMHGLSNPPMRSLGVAGGNAIGTGLGNSLEEFVNRYKP